MTLHAHQGWVIAPYEEVADPVPRVEIGLAFGRGREPTMWLGAFLDYVDGDRVARVRYPPELAQQNVTVWLRVNGAAAVVGDIRL